MGKVREWKLASYCLQHLAAKPPTFTCHLSTSKLDENPGKFAVGKIYSSLLIECNSIIIGEYAQTHQVQSSLLKKGTGPFSTRGPE